MKFTKSITSAQQLLKPVTIRDFKGGWNVIDTDLNLTTRYSKRLQNFNIASDGSLAIRPGTQLFVNVQSMFTDPNVAIIHMKYFSNHLIVVGDNGQILAVNASARVTRIWDTYFANKLPGAPAPWGACTFVSSAEINGDLILCNGIDKPLLIPATLNVSYLADLGTNSNINTPICMYVYVFGEYTIMAGDPTNPSLLHISNRGSSGTWFGDPAPNDAIQVNLSSRVPVGSSEIFGITSFRDKIIVGFEECVVLGTLGIYSSGGDHEPNFGDVILAHGIISHHSAQGIGDDVFFLDQAGVPSLTRTTLSNSIRPDRASQLIDPEIQKMLSRLSIAGIRDRVFSVYNQIDGQYMLFIPNESEIEKITETRVFVFTSIPALDVKAWTDYTGWNFTCGAITSLKTVFFADKNANIWLFGNRDKTITGDFSKYAENFTDNTNFTDNSGFTPTKNRYGTNIPFYWEMPWGDFDLRMNTKQSQHIAFETTGTGAFTCKAYVDKFYIDNTSSGEGFTDETVFSDGFGFISDQPIYFPPLLSLDFIGGDNSGFGSARFGNDNFGAGRIASDERLYAWPAKYKIMKLVFSGQTNKPLQFISISLTHKKGTIRR